ncbi:MAG: M15 family metallopeptidase [Ginsengibacter sp.]
MTIQNVINHRKEKVSSNDSIPIAARRLMKAYPDFIIGYKDDYIIWKDSARMLFNDFKNPKSFEDLLNDPSLSDQFTFQYHKGKLISIPKKNYDPGRIRYEPFFFKMYGANQYSVRKKLVLIDWCPKLGGKKILITSVNGIDKKVKKISDELDKHPELRQYVANIGGTFNWRKINGTKIQSAHSFGISIDINTTYSNYWQWECNCTNENSNITYKNRIPQLIVDIFEKNGFIWGGKWYHFDTMHFEYRPELL